MKQKRGGSYIIVLKGTLHFKYFQRIKTNTITNKECGNKGKTSFELYNKK